MDAARARPRRGSLVAGTGLEDVGAAGYRWHHRRAVGCSSSPRVLSRLSRSSSVARHGVQHRSRGLKSHPSSPPSNNTSFLSVQRRRRRRRRRTLLTFTIGRSAVPYRPTLLLLAGRRVTGGCCLFGAVPLCAVPVGPACSSTGAGTAESSPSWLLAGSRAPPWLTPTLAVLRTSTWSWPWPWSCSPRRSPSSSGWCKWRASRWPSQRLHRRGRGAATSSASPSWSFIVAVDRGPRRLPPSCASSLLSRTSPSRPPTSMPADFYARRLLCPPTSTPRRLLRPAFRE